MYMCIVHVSRQSLVPNRCHGVASHLAIFRHVHRSTVQIRAYLPFPMNIASSRGNKIPRASFRRNRNDQRTQELVTYGINRLTPRSGFRVCITAASSRPNDLSRLSRVLTWMFIRFIGAARYRSARPGDP